MMGMFDYLSCEMDLPPGEKYANGEYQTKDFRNRMEKIKIRKDGVIEPFVGSDGEFNFYDCKFIKDGKVTGIFVPKTNTKTYWIEYQATYKGGRVTDIEIVQESEIAP